MRYLTLGISLEIYLFSLLRISLWYVLMRDLDFFRSRLKKKTDTRAGMVYTVCLGSIVSFSCAGSRKEKLLQAPAANAGKPSPYLWLSVVLCHIMVRREPSL